MFQPDGSCEQPASPCWPRGIALELVGVDADAASGPFGAQILLQLWKVRIE